MSEISKERRAEMRRDAEYILSTPGILKGVVTPAADVLALLDAADERDRLRAEPRIRVVKKPWAPSAIEDDTRDEIARLNAEGIAKCSRENR